jgi:RHH-type proline utilization regulon transcriptional repressor/proline dehydrogenase/delta 1-pyrroline-5-carboxylate dehydrogenase
LGGGGGGAGGGAGAGAVLAVSTALKLPRPLRALLKERRVKVFVESDAEWLERVAAGRAGVVSSGAAAAGFGGVGGASDADLASQGISIDGGAGDAVARGAARRIRMIGGDPVALATALGGSADVAVYAGEVTRAARVELLPFLREQAVSITNHRFGSVSPFVGGILS